MARLSDLVKDYKHYGRNDDSMKVEFIDLFYNIKAMFASSLDKFKIKNDFDNSTVVKRLFD